MDVHTTKLLDVITTLRDIGYSRVSGKYLRPTSEGFSDIVDISLPETLPNLKYILDVLLCYINNNEDARDTLLSSADDQFVINLNIPAIYAYGTHGVPLCLAVPDRIHHINKENAPMTFSIKSTKTPFKIAMDTISAKFLLLRLRLKMDASEFRDKFTFIWGENFEYTQMSFTDITEFVGFMLNGKETDQFSESDKHSPIGKYISQLTIEAIWRLFDQPSTIIVLTGDKPELLPIHAKLEDANSKHDLKYSDNAVRVLSEMIFGKTTAYRTVYVEYQKQVMEIRLPRNPAKPGCNISEYPQKIKHIISETLEKQVLPTKQIAVLADLTLGNIFIEVLTDEVAPVYYIEHDRQ